jgi:tetratricopeptide (TPR) repeat protein
VLSAEFVDLSGDGAGEPSPQSPYFSTNVGARAGRLVLFVVDENSLAPASGRALLASADRLLDRLGSQDRVGLVVIPSRGASVEFSADPAQVRQGLGKVIGRARRLSSRVGLTEALSFVEGLGRDSDGVVERECGGITDLREHEICVETLAEEARRVVTDFRRRSTESLKVLETVLDGLSAIEGPKSLLLITEGLPGDEAAEFRGLAKRAAVSRASLFIVQVGGGHDVDAARQSLGPSEMESQGFLASGIMDLATMTRGAVFRPQGSGEALYDRIGRELSGYYVLGFAPEAEEHDGRDHGMKVSVPARKVTVRWRSTVNVPAARASLPDEAVLAGMLRAPFLATGLSLRVATYALPEKGGARVRVVVSAAIEGAQHGAAVGYVLLDGKGRAAATGSGRLGDVSGATAPFTALSLVEPGQYRLRLAAVDGRGQRGSVEHAVTARVTAAAGIEWGDLVVGAAPASGQPFRPSVDLSAATTLVGRLEVQAPDAPQLQEVVVALEIAETADGAAIVTVPATAVDAPDSPQRVHRAAIASSLLPPGDYVLRAILSRGGNRVGSATRPFQLREDLARNGEEAKGVALGSVLAVVGRFEPSRMLDPEVASHYLDRMAVLLPGPLSPASEAAALHARRGEAAKILDDLANVQTEDARVAFLRGLGLYARGEWGGASTQLRHSIALASDFMPAAVYLGACHAAVGQDLEAIGAWQTALVSETKSPVLFAQLADALLRVRDGERAGAALKEALSQWPDDEDLLRRMGIADAMAGDRSEALRLLTNRISRHPDDTGALFVVLRLLLDRLSGAPPSKGSPDREQFARYARAYVDARAPSWEVVSQWLKYLDRPH